MRGTVVHIWMSPDSLKKSRYGLHTLGGIVGIVVLVQLMILGGTALIFSMDWPKESALVLLCLGTVVLALFLAAQLGRRSVQNATVFFLTEEDQLFAVDVRRLIYTGRSPLDLAVSAFQTEQFLRKLASAPCIPAGADEIRSVEQIRENGSHYALVCRVRRPNQQIIRRTYFLVKGMEDQESLLRQLERREHWDSALEPGENRNSRGLLICALVCAGFAVLCVLSHPAVAQLPQYLYFPCLGAAFAALCGAVWFAVRQRRGE